MCFTSFCCFLLILFWCHTEQCLANDIVIFKSSNISSCKLFGCVCDRSSIVCVDVPPMRLDQQIFQIVPHLETISFDRCHQDELNLDIFSSIKSLRAISVRNCAIDRLVPANLTSLYSLDLHGNKISDWNSIYSLLDALPSLKSLDLSNNVLTKISKNDYATQTILERLNASNNQIVDVENVPDVKTLDLSCNQITRIAADWPLNLISLNLSHNSLVENIPPLIDVNLIDIDFSDSSMKNLPIINLPHLRRLSIRNNNFKVIDFHDLQAPNLTELDLSYNRWLYDVLGSLPESVEKLYMSNTELSHLPSTFFARVRNLALADLSTNNWSCHQCLVDWIDSLPINLRPKLKCPKSNFKNCSIGISKRVSDDEKFIVRVKPGSEVVLPCDTYGDPSPIVSWWLVNPKIHIGTYNPINKKISMNWTRDGAYEVLVGGNLLVSNANKYMIERYHCVANNSMEVAIQAIHLRLDLSNWYHLEMSQSVFWGSILASLITCAGTFLLNILWILCRQVGLWWIKRLERASRIRGMVNALVGYRQRQMANLHDTYHKKIEQVRENYHHQVDQLRTSYFSQMEKFRDYRAAQMESMNQHIESIRDNYNQQVNRLREYGSRRVEQLWEGYESQANRIRAFSLQQRLCLMRKYKVKQHKINKLFERFGDDQTHNFTKPHPEVILNDPLRGLKAYSRSDSFHSLPDYLLRCDDFHIQSRDEIFNALSEEKSSTSSESDEDTQCCSQARKSLCKQESLSLEHILPVRSKHSEASNSEKKLTSVELYEREPLYDGDQDF